MLTFLEAISSIPDFRIVGMITYPLNEVLLATLVGVLCGRHDWDEIEDLSNKFLPWLRQFLPYKAGIPKAQTFRTIFAPLPVRMLQQQFCGVGAQSARSVRWCNCH